MEWGRPYVLQSHCGPVISRPIPMDLGHNEIGTHRADRPYVYQSYCVPVPCVTLTLNHKTGTGT